MKLKLISVTVLILLSFTQNGFAQERQGRTSLETPNARPKENMPAQTGVQRVQDSTQSRTKKALGAAAQQQGKTKAAVSKIIKKK